jgi:ubiquinone/menaquinone biosynthesis C-methylase UbiE
MVSEPRSFEAFQLPLTACPYCAVNLRPVDNELRCARCQRVWEIRDGVPRFFDPGYYWGEVSQAEASTLVSDARENGWREAVEKHFSHDPAMAFSILQWQQRASWLPLLGLNKNAVALDIGSGYGAITHAMANMTGEVYSLEAIPERIEFTRIRLSQEGLNNVRLIQGSATQLPLQENLFDLVVVNGVLEWVGEWDLEGNPREVQLRFLRKIHRLLKPQGILLVGIENRIGYNNFAGAVDHSGLAYTSLMPRSLASLVLRLSRKRHHRTILNSKRQYRTYTYSELGYRKLLSRSGFDHTTFYEAVPGYNRPFSLVPLDRRSLSAHVLDAISGPVVAPGGSRLRRLVKYWASRMGLLRPFVPEFVIIAAKDAAYVGEHNSIWQQVKALSTTGAPITKPVHYLLGGRPSKWTIRTCQRDDPQRCMMLKASPPAYETVLAAEHRILEHLRSRLRENPDPTFSVPRPIGTFEVAGWHLMVETVAEGLPLSQLMFRRSRTWRAAFLRHEFVRCVAIAAEVSELLKGNIPVHKIGPAWYQIPGNVEASAGIAPLVAPEADKWQRRGIRAHGDFTTENIFWDEPTKRISIIDWESPFEGVPPLYDVFTLLLSATPALALEKQQSATPESVIGQQFLAAFFGSQQWSTATREILLQAAGRLGQNASDIWPQFLLFLIIRINHFRSRQSPFAAQYSHLLQLAIQFQHLFVCRQAGQPTRIESAANLPIDVAQYKRLSEIPPPGSSAS